MTDNATDGSDQDWPPCPNCGTPPFQVVGQAAECNNENCSVLQFAVDRDHDTDK